MSEFTLYEARQWRAAAERNVEAARFAIRRAHRQGCKATDSMRANLQYHHRLMRKARRAVADLIEQNGEMP